MKKNVRTAVIGVGNMGKNHARVYHEISHFVAVADLNELLGNSVASHHNVQFYSDFRKMLDKERPEAVSVVVPTPLHKQITIECLRRKIPVLVEKPIASSVTEARQMLKEATKQKTFLMVGHIERFNPAVLMLKKIIASGRLGKVLNMLAMRVGISPPPTPRSDVTGELGIHDLDVMNFLLDEFPKKSKVIRKKIFKDNIADCSTMHLEYGSTTAVIETNWITPIKIRKLYVTGINGFAELDYINQKLTLYDKILNTRQVGDFFELTSLFDGKRREVFVSKKEPLKEELQYFLQNIGSSSRENVSSAIEALRIITAHDS